MLHGSRRDFLKVLSAAAVASSATLPSFSVRAAEHTLRLANNLALTHPLNIYLKEFADRVKSETNGKVEIQIFPSSQLGSDTDTLSQIRAGAVDFFTLSPLILGTYVPLAQISGIGFAFKSYDQVWAAMDGDLGGYVRKKIEATPLFAFEKIWDNGFRQTTTSTRPIVKPEDLQGMKLRVPPSPLWTSMYRAFKSAPTSINFSEVYSALQTHVVEGQENPLAIVYTSKLYEVQKYASMTNHMWDGFWLLGNKESFAKLPKDVQDVITRAANDSAIKQRAATAALDGTVRNNLQAAGLKFNDVDAEPFRAQLIKAGFYDDWKKKFGAEEWAVLEKYSGRLG
jgi:tripartite ATP-independent transporter DctP family solute receptor